MRKYELEKEISIVKGKDYENVNDLNAKLLKENQLLIEES